MARKTGSRADITGPRIHAAAQRLFAAKGYAAVSMRDIASEVGVQAGALYNYIPDKQSLLYDLMLGHMEELHAAWAQTDPPKMPLDRLDHFTRFHIDFHLDRPDAVFIAYMELRNLSEKNFAIIEKHRRTYEAILESILQDGQNSGDFVISDKRIATMAIIAMLTGVTTWYREGGRLSRSRIQEAYARMVRQSVS